MPEFTRQEVDSALATMNGIIVRSRLTIDASLIDRAPHLRFIGRTGSGMELIDTAYAASRGILCMHSPEGNCDSVAEHALGMILHLLHRFGPAHRSLQEGLWERSSLAPWELQGRTVGIIGVGHTGTALARRLSAFGCTVLGYDKYKQEYGAGLLEMSAMEKIFDQADILSLHLPLTTETYHLANADFFRQFHKPIWFINTSRGPVADTLAIAEALEKRQIRGVGLDVFETEPILNAGADEAAALLRIAAHPHSILSPHTAGTSPEAFYKMGFLLAQKIVNWYNQLSDTALGDPVDKN